jgi:hypothetical protein
MEFLLNLGYKPLQDKPGYYIYNNIIVKVSKKSVTFNILGHNNVVKQLVSFAKWREENMWKQYAENLTKMTFVKANDKLYDMIDTMVDMTKNVSKE